MTFLHQAVSHRNADRHLDPAWVTFRDADPPLTPGGRVVYRRTRWSPSACNQVAILAGLGSEGASND